LYFYDALVGQNHTEDGLDDGRLARAIRPQHGGDARLVEAEVHAVQDVVFAEGFVEVVYRYHC
jgi:hypothetical protein